jgi:hypothetical protein
MNLFAGACQWYAHFVDTRVGEVVRSICHTGHLLVTFKLLLTNPVSLVTVTLASGIIMFLAISFLPRAVLFVCEQSQHRPC